MTSLKTITTDLTETQDNELTKDNHHCSDLTETPDHDLTKDNHH